MRLQCLMARQGEAATQACWVRDARAAQAVASCSPSSGRVALLFRHYLSPLFCPAYSPAWKLMGERAKPRKRE